ncbi:MAG: M48 family metalloprotease, partial [Acidobacteria bacterium]|nr:M48 family metalloprotease [Acidobacteriota bacterium]
EIARAYGLMPAIHKDADAQRIAAYVQEVGKRLTANVKRKEIQYRFYFKDEPHFVNAGALPGGQIVIGRGLLELLESEDELAAILGHEIAHVDERHAIERLQYELQSRKIGMRGLYRIAQIGVVLFQMGYTKEKEDEADRVGLALTVRAGYSPAGAVEVMKRFDRLFGGQARPATSPVEEMTRMPFKSLREYFRSHPPARERIATLEKEIQARGYNAAQAQKPLGVRAIFLAEQAAEFDRHGVFDRAIARYEEALKADREYWIAWEGMAQAKWRSGDAAGTTKATTEALQRRPDMPRLWKLFAEALAASGRAGAPDEFTKQYRELSPRLTDPAQKQILSERAGLDFFTGTRSAKELYQMTLTSGMTPFFESEHRRRVAWWMWRTGKAQEALKELEAARQVFPQGVGVGTEMAWALSDLGRQADAMERMDAPPGTGGVVVTPPGVPSSLYRTQTGDGQGEALSAVILWRTGQREEAKSAFRRATEADPVWMVAKWVENNYSAEAAAVIAKLQAEEMARRKKEEAKRAAAAKR